MKRFTKFVIFLALIALNSAQEQDRKSILKQKIFNKIDAGEDQTLSELLEEYKELQENDDVDTLERYYYNYFWPIFFPISLFGLICFILAICFCATCCKECKSKK